MDASSSKRGQRLRAFLRDVYFGGSRKRMPWRIAILIVDVAVIGFFIAAPFLEQRPEYLAVDLAIAALLGSDLAARAWAYGSLARWLRRPIVWVDLFVLLTMLAPGVFSNFGFLRVIRLWSLVHNGFLWRAIGAGKYQHTRVEDVTKAVTTFITFIFITTGFVYALYARDVPGLNHYVDALYFTVTTLTTTGFGDIVLPGAGGRLLSIAIMIAGIVLFVRLAQSIFRPHKVYHVCPSCGLTRHDPDAVHCKACGVVLHIRDEGRD